jgi:hypothetical protein
MTRMRWFLVGFWAFVALMLAWQFSSYDTAVDRQLAEHPKQEHYYYNGSASPFGTTPDEQGGGANPNVHVADVRQTAYQTEADVPNPGMTTATVVVKNQGNTKAVSVQVYVRPYRGGQVGGGDLRGGGNPSGPLSDEDPYAQLGQWVSFPDLAPGESASEKATFTTLPGLRPGPNPNPKIVFETEKPKP